ncbi:MAG TPA: hypothetical protein VJA16_16815, partial [Thermoanaerobaculia bacterium]
SQDTSIVGPALIAAVPALGTRSKSTAIGPTASAPRDLHQSGDLLHLVTCKIFLLVVDILVVIAAVFQHGRRGQAGEEGQVPQPGHADHRAGVDRRSGGGAAHQQQEEDGRAQPASPPT